MSEPADLCGAISNSGPKGEPLACAYAPGHDGAHSWGSLLTFYPNGGEPTADVTIRPHADATVLPHVFVGDLLVGHLKDLRNDVTPVKEQLRDLDLVRGPFVELHVLVDARRVKIGGQSEHSHG